MAGANMAVGHVPIDMGRATDWLDFLLLQQLRLPIFEK